MNSVLRFAFCAAIICAAVCCSSQKHLDFCSVGGEELNPVLDSWSAIYAESGRKGPQHEGRGNRTASLALADRRCSLAFVSEALPQEDIDRIVKKLSKPPKAVPVAMEVMAFAAARNFPADAVSIEQLQALYGKGEQDAAALGLGAGKIEALGINSASDRYFWMKSALGIKSFSDRVKEMSGPLALVDRAATSYAIGYARPAEATDAVKLLQIKKDGRTFAVNAPDYPFRRYYYVYATDISAESRAFLEFALSDRGQKALQPLGLFPLPADALRKAREEIMR